MFQSKSSPRSVVQMVAAISFTSNLRIRIRVQIIADDKKYSNEISLPASSAPSPRNKYDMLFKDFKGFSRGCGFKHVHSDSMLAMTWR